MQPLSKMKRLNLGTVTSGERNVEGRTIVQNMLATLDEKPELLKILLDGAELARTAKVLALNDGRIYNLTTKVIINGVEYNYNLFWNGDEQLIHLEGYTDEREFKRLGNRTAGSINIFDRAGTNKLLGEHIPQEKLTDAYATFLKMTSPQEEPASQVQQQP